MEHNSKSEICDSLEDALPSLDHTRQPQRVW
jgi:hypothetical protein